MDQCVSADIIHGRGDAVRLIEEVLQLLLRELTAHYMDYLLVNFFAENAHIFQVGLLTVHDSLLMEATSVQEE